MEARFRLDLSKLAALKEALDTYKGLIPLCGAWNWSSAHSAQTHISSSQKSGRRDDKFNPCSAMCALKREFPTKQSDREPGVDL